MDELGIEAVYWPDEIAGLHHITLAGKHNQSIVCKLEALRWSEEAFTFEDCAENLHWAFDHISWDAVGLSEEVHRRRMLLHDRLGRDFLSCGVIGIISIRTVPEARGKRLALELLKYLQELHSGLPWFAVMLAAPIDHRHDDPEFPNLRKRLIQYYTSDPSLGFRQAGDIDAPALLAAAWYSTPGEAL